ncbi:MAG: GDYXXLXY domain-containing protein [Candidatus Aureabacteria bacterium]|nr:GDYXXLXY domain-containing protein [Candidatus Auribacterota bacterium]
MKKIWLFTFVVVILQAGSVYTMAFNKLSIKRYGSPIKVRVEPIDPRSLFRGDYVILRYPFSSVKREDIGLGKCEMHDIKNIYIVLKKTGDLWEYERASSDKPEISRDEVFLKGSVVSDVFGYSNNLGVRYGIESYFVPEGEGRILEKSREKGNLAAEIYVDSKGRALLTGLFVKGEKATFGK